MARQNVGAQASCFAAAFGHMPPPRHPRTSRVLEVGSQWRGCKCSLQEIDIFWCFQNKRTLLVSAGLKTLLSRENKRPKGCQTVSDVLPRHRQQHHGRDLPEPRGEQENAKEQVFELWKEHALEKK